MYCDNAYQASRGGYAELLLARQVDAWTKERPSCTCKIERDAPCSNPEKISRLARTPWRARVQVMAQRRAVRQSFLGQTEATDGLEQSAHCAFSRKNPPRRHV